MSIRFLMSIGLLAISMNGCAAQGNWKTPFSANNSNETNGQYVSTTVPQSHHHPALLDPSKANERAPDEFKVKFETTKGDFVLQVVRDAAPNGVDRFYNLVKIGYFQDIVIFRAVKGFMFQFGIHGDPAVSAQWSDANIKDDPNAGVSNTPGTICFAKTGAPNSRSAQMFVSLGNNSFLDNQGFTPFGKVVEGLDVVAKINTEYGENKGDVQGKFKQQGNDYILKAFPNLDIIKAAEVVN